MTGIDRLRAEVAAQTPQEAEARRQAFLRGKRARRANQGRARQVVYVWQPWQEPLPVHSFLTLQQPHRPSPQPTPSQAPSHRLYRSA